jgi:hypothetical protein
MKTRFGGRSAEAEAPASRRTAENSKIGFMDVL